jgi:hypothetical protein
VAGRNEEIFAPDMMSMDPVYHFHYGGNDVVLRGQDQVKSLYRMWAETNPIKRYTLSSRNKFVTNPDGSVDLYLQADSPGKAKEANWLPAPKAKFIPMLRLYWPKETPTSIIDGTWTPPAVKQVS